MLFYQKMFNLQPIAISKNNTHVRDDNIKYIEMVSLLHVCFQLNIKTQAY